MTKPFIIGETIKCVALVGSDPSRLTDFKIVDFFELTVKEAVKNTWLLEPGTDKSAIGFIFSKMGDSILSESSAVHGWTHYIPTVVPSRNGARYINPSISYHNAPPSNEFFVVIPLEDLELVLKEHFQMV